MLRALILWPHRRVEGERRTRAHPEAHEGLDGLSLLERHGIRIRIFHPSRYPFNPLSRRGTVLAGIDVLRSLRVLCAYPAFDVLVSIADSSSLVFMLVKRLLRLSKPVVVIDPALSHDYPFRKRLQANVLPYADHVIVYGNAQLRYLEKEFRPPVRATFLRHRMDTAFFDPAKVSEGKPFGGEEYIYSIGNDPMRDFRTLAEAAAGLPIRTVLQTKRKVAVPAGAAVEIHPGWTTYEQLRDRYGHARLVIVPLHPTIYAGGINGLLEAMSMGKPIVTTRSEGLADYVEDGVNAILVPPGDAKAMGEAIRRLLADPAFAAALGANARRYCLERCAMEVYARNLAGILEASVARA